jgi:hypothetical protein
MTLLLTLLLATRVYRIGGEVKAPVVIARVEPRVPPNTPCRGFVMFTCVIDERGAVTALHDATPKPDAFSRAYGRAFQQWKFKPATLRGRAVAVEYVLTIQFKCQ